MDRLAGPARDLNKGDPALRNPWIAGNAKGRSKFFYPGSRFNAAAESPGRTVGKPQDILTIHSCLVPLCHNLTRRGCHPSNRNRRRSRHCTSNKFRQYFLQRPSR